MLSVKFAHELGLAEPIKKGSANSITASVALSTTSFRQFQTYSKLAGSPLPVKVKPESKEDLHVSGDIPHVVSSSLDDGGTGFARTPFDRLRAVLWQWQLRRPRFGKGQQLWP